MKLFYYLIPFGKPLQNPFKHLKNYGLCIFVLLLAVLSSNKGYGGTYTYNVSSSGLVNCTSSACGTAGPYNNCSTGKPGFKWTDASSGTIVSVSIQFYIGVNCNNTGSQAWTLNGAGQTAFTSTSNGCSCSTVIAANKVTLNANVANYTEGGVNTVLLTPNVSSCLGFYAGLTGGYYAIITVTTCSATGGSVAQSPASGSTICQGPTVTYTASGYSGTFDYFEYQWNSTSGSYSGPWITTNGGGWGSGPNGQVATLYVRASIKDPSGLAACEAKSAPVSVTVDANSVAGTMTQSPASGSEVCQGTNVGYSISGNTYSSEYFQYAWNSSTPNSGSWGISGNGTNSGTWTSSPNGQQASLYVDAVVQNGVCPAVTTNAVYVLVDQIPTAGTLTQSPASGTTVCQGTNVGYSISGNSSYTSEYFQYQWNASPPNSGSWGISGNGTNSGTWTSSPNGAVATLYVDAVVTNGVCPAVTTNVVNVVIDENSSYGTISGATASGGVYLTPACNANSNGTIPQVSISGYVGSPVWNWEYGEYETASGTQSGTPNWQNNWVASANSGTCCFPINPGTSGAAGFDVVVTNGVCPAVTSPVVLIEEEPNPAPTSLVASSTAYCSASAPSTITLTATYPYGLNTTSNVLSQYSSINFYSGSCGGTLLATVAPSSISYGGSTATATYTFAAPTTAGTYNYYTQATSPSCTAGGCSGGSATVTVTAIPATPGAITGSAFVCPSTTGLVYSVTAVPSATTYTWSLPSGWSITSGGGTNSITVTAGTTGQNGTISVTAGNGCGNSSASTLAVNTVSIASQSTATQTTCAGGTAFNQLSVTPGAGSGYTYQWYRNYIASTSGSDPVASGGTSSTYTPPNAAASTTYFYCLLNGCVTSAISGAIIADQPVATISPANTSICQGGSVTLTAAGGTSYAWSSGTNPVTVTAAGTYKVTVTDASSCTASASRVITVNASPPTPAALTGTTTICPNATTQLASPFTLPTGGTITSANGYKVHTFTGSGSFVTTSAITDAEVLVVGGGGGGGSSIGGGGGAGGVVYESNQPFAASTTYAVTVGPGGAGGASQQVRGTSGTASSIGTINVSAPGGGGGGYYNDVSGLSGGCGGGAGGSQNSNISGGTVTAGTLGTGGTGTIYGNAAGNVTDSRNTFCATNGTGGGGAGYATPNTETGDPNANRNGGSGVAFDISNIGTPVYFGGGGGDGTYCLTTINNNGGSGGGGGGASTSGTGGSGGTGGINNGAAGGNGANLAGGAGGANTGGGGGGGSWSTGTGGAGGSGIVIIRYPDPTAGVWSTSNSSVATVSTTGLVTGHSAGSCTITYTLTTCSGTTNTSTTITVSPAPASTPAYSTPVTYCAEVAITPNTTTNTGGAATYTVSPALPAGLSINSSTGAITGTPTTIAGVAAANYTVTATNTCGAPSEAVNITISGEIPSTPSYVTPVEYCANNPITSNTTTNTGGAATYSSSPALPAGLSINSNTGAITGTPTTAAGIAANNYTITAANNCGSVNQAVNITIYPAVTAAVTPTSAVAYCAYNSSNTITVTAGAGTPGYTYSWSGGLGSGTIATPPSGTTATYTATVTDNLGCTATATTGSVSVDPVFTATPSPASATKLCSYATTGAISAGPSGGSGTYSTYSWNNGLGSSASGTPTITSATVYSVTITDSKGCTASGSTGAISINPVLTATVSPSVTTTYCPYAASGVLSVAAGGGTSGYTYAWSNSLGSASTATPTSTSAIVYTVTVTDADNCTAAGNTGSVNVDPALIITPTPVAATFYCSYATSGVLGAGASGGSGSYSTYAWSNGLGSASTATPTAATVSAYHVTVTDSKNCTASGTTGTITANPAVTASPTPSSTSLYCSYANGGVLAANAGGGSPGYSYTWSNSLGTGATASPTSATATVYSVTVLDSHSCSVTGSTGSVTIDPAVTAVPTPTAATFYCSYATSNVLAGGAGGGTAGYTYNWSNGLGTSVNATPLAATVSAYSVTVTDSKNCTASGTTGVITVNPAIIVSPTPSASPSYVCTYANSNAIAANASGGSGTISTYAWNNGLGNASTGTPTIATGTVYTVTVTDSKNCTATGSTGSVLDYAPPTITGTTPGYICGTGTVNLGATSSAGVVNWWPTSAGGTPPSANTGTSYTTPIISTNTTYYVNATSNGCTTQSTTSVLATVYPTSIESGGFYYSTISGFTPPTQGTRIVSTNAVNAGTVKQAISGLLPCTTYYYQTYIVTNGDTVYATGGQGVVTTGTLNATITLTSGTGTDGQALCYNTALTPITYAVGGGGTGAGVTGLPPGVTGNYSSGVFTITGTPASSGTYNYTVTTTGTCGQTSANGTITAYPNFTTASQSGGTSPVCYNTAPGTITASGVGGTGSYTYLWYINSSPTGLTANTYAPGNLTATSTIYCAVTSGSCGTVNTSGATITVDGNLTAGQSGGTSPVCYNTAPGTFTAAGNGGTGSYTYLWYKNGASSGITTNTYAPGNLTVTSTIYCAVTSGSCGTVNTAGTTITVYGNLTASQSGGTTPICYNAAPGTLTASGSGGTGSYTYLWYLNGSSSGITTNTYAPGNLTSTATIYCAVTSSSCGTVNAAGTTITVDGNLTADQTTGTSPVCYNASPGTFTAIPGGGTGSYTYQWYTGSGSIGGATTSTYSPGNITATTTYYVAITSGSCGTVNSSSTTITVDAALTASVSGGTTPACYSSDPGVFTATGHGGTGTYTYLWYNSSGSIGGATSSTFDPGVLASSNTYSCSVTSGTCGTVSTGPSAITVEPPVSSYGTVSASSGLTQTVCDNVAPNSGNPFTASGATGSSGSFSYQWYYQIGLIAAPTGSSTAGWTACDASTGTGYNTNSFTASGTGSSITYACLVTPASPVCNPGQWAANDIQITVLTTGPQETAGGEGDVCLNGAVLLTSSLSEVIPATYQWYSSTSAGFGSPVTISGATATTYAPPTSASGTLYYEIIATFSGSGCSPATSNAQTVVVYTAPSASISGGTSPVCYNTSPGIFTATGNGGSGSFTYQWYKSSGTVSGATSSTYTPGNITASNGYYCSVTDVAGCGTVGTSTTSITVDANLTAAISGGTSPICYNTSPGTFTATPAGGTGTYTYQWYNGSGSVNGATASTYSPGNITVSNSYFCAVTSGSCGTVNTSIVNITVHANLTATIGGGTSPVCYNTAPGTLHTTANGGSGTYTYQWYNSAGSVSGATASTFAPGNLTASDVFHCMVTGGICGAVNTATVNITVDAAVAANISGGTSPVCYNTAPGTFTASGTGGTGTYTYQWYNSAGSVGGATANTYAPGNLTISDSYYCAVTSGSCGTANTSTTAITVSADLAANMAGGTSPVCYNTSPGAFTASGSGGTGTYTYQWYDGSGSLSGATSSTYNPGSLTISNSYHCDVTSGSCGTVSTSTTNIVVYGNLTAAISGGTSPICYNDAPGTFTATSNGGTGTYTYQWYNNSGTIGGQTNDTYTPGSLTVSDSYHCAITSGSCGTVNTATTSISVNTLVIAPVITAADALCNGSTNGTVTVTTGSTGGTTPYSYSLNGGAYQSGTLFTGLAPNNYSVITQDGLGCLSAASNTVTVGQPAALTAAVISSTNVLCSGAANGTVTVSTIPTGGTAPYTYSLNNGPFQAGTSFTALAPNSYTVVAKDDNGCIAPTSNSVTVTEPALLGAAAITATNATCNGTSDGIVTVSSLPAGGTAPYSYSLNNGAYQGSTSFTGLAIGNYTVTAKDANGCISAASNSVTVSEPAVLTAVISGGTSPVCYNTAPGTFTATGSGGSGSYTYQWYNTSGSVSGQTASTYAPGNITSAGAYHCAVTSGTCGTVNTSTTNIAIDPAISAYTVTGGTACGSVPVALSGSQTNVSYQLYNNNVYTNISVAGTGNAISFGTLSSAGIYTVTAVACGNSVNMNGSATVNANPAVYIATGGSVCTSQTVTLSGSETGIIYRLLLGNTEIDSLTGTGTGLNFGTVSAPGTYTVAGFNTADNCSLNMTNSLIISGAPNVYQVSGVSHCGSLVLSLSGSDLGIRYIISRDQSSDVGTYIAGTGGAITFSASNDVITSAGTYYIYAYGGGCSAYMNDSEVLATGSLQSNNVYLNSNATPGGSACGNADISMNPSQTGVNYQLLLNGTVSVGSPVSGTGGRVDFGTQSVPGTYTVQATSISSPCTPANMNNSVQISTSSTLVSAPVLAPSAPAAVCEGTSVYTDTSIAGQGGVPGATDTFDVSINGGNTWSVYTLGSNINTTGLSGTNEVQVRAWRYVPDSSACYSSPYNYTYWSIGSMSAAATSVTPSVNTVCEGSTTSITFTESGGTLGANSRWTLYNTDPTIGNPSPVASSATNTVSVQAPTTVGQNVYYLRAQSLSGTCATSAVNTTVQVDQGLNVLAENTHVCSGTPADIVLYTSYPTGTTTYSWTVGSVTGGITGANSGSGTDITDNLNAAADSTGTVTYIVTPSNSSYTNGGTCPVTPTNVVVSVSSYIAVTSPSTVSICNGNLLYTPVSNISGATFSWTRSALGSVTTNNTSSTNNITSAGSGNLIKDSLGNAAAAPAQIVYTLVASYQCGSNNITSAPATVTVTDNPQIGTGTPTIYVDHCGAGNLITISNLTGGSGVAPYTVYYHESPIGGTGNVIPYTDIVNSLPINIVPVDLGAAYYVDSIRDYDNCSVMLGGRVITHLPVLATSDTIIPCNLTSVGSSVTYYNNSQAGDGGGNTAGYMASITPAHSALGTTQTTLSVYSTTPKFNQTVHSMASSHSFMKRSHYVQPSTQDSAMVTIYLSQGEVDSLIAASASDGFPHQQLKSDLSNLQIAKYDYLHGQTGIPGPSTSYDTVSYITPVSVSPNTPLAGVWAVTFGTPGFSNLLSSTTYLGCAIGINGATSFTTCTSGNTTNIEVYVVGDVPPTSFVVTPSVGAPINVTIPSGSLTYETGGPVAYWDGTIQVPVHPTTTTTYKVTSLTNAKSINITPSYPSDYEDDGNGGTAVVNGVATITITGAFTANASNTGPYLTNQTISLSASPASETSYSWSGPSGYTATGQTTTINGATTAMGGIYTVTVTGAGGCTATAATNVIVYSNTTYTWTGTSSTDWTVTTNWAPASPIGGPNNCAVDVIIPHVTNIPVIASAVQVGNIQMNANAQLTLNGANISICKNWVGGSGGSAVVGGTGVVVLNGTTAQTISGNTQMQEAMVQNSTGVSMLSGSVLDIFTALDLQTGNFDAANGNLTFKSTSVTNVGIIDDFSSGYSGTLTGSINAERYYATSLTYDQHYMGSPVNNPSLAQFNASGTSGYILDPNCDETILPSNSPYGTVFGFDETHGSHCGMQQWKVLTSGNAQNGMGYSILKSGTGTLVLNGTANLNASYSLSGMTNSNWSNTTLQNHTEHSGWQLVSNPYLANINLTSTPAGFDNQVQVWNANGPYAGSYQPGTIGTDATIAPFQAFMVHKTTPGGTATFTMNGTDRVRTAYTFFQQNANQLNIVAANTANGALDQTMVAFNSAATDTFDTQYDATKMPGKLTRHTLYTVNNGLWMSRNILHDEATTSTVPMGFEPGVNSTYSLTFNGLNSFDPTSYIYLEDEALGVMYNVRNGDYTFHADSADNWNRFVLHFTPPARIATTDASCTASGTISIQQPGTANWNYALTDSGHAIITSGTLNQSQQVTVGVPAGTYTLTLIDTNSYTVTKTILINGPELITASFQLSRDTVQVNQNVTLTSTSAGASSYQWSLGNGSTSNSAITTVSYTQPGLYTVGLLVTDPSGCSSGKTENILVTPVNTTGINSLTGTSQLKIWSHDNKVYVDFTALQLSNASVIIYDILGQEISNEKVTNNVVYQKELDNTEAAYMIVMVRNDNEITTKKVFINNIR